jgi:hypothetical protein
MRRATLALWLIAGLVVLVLASCGPAVASTPAPRPCHAPTLPSGDAAHIGGRTYVCTDGTWVRVVTYGT